jgi:hypothetical protein
VTLHAEALSHDEKGIPVRISMAQYEWRLGAAYMALAEKSGSKQHWRSASHWYGRSVERFDQLEAEGHLRSGNIRADAGRARAALERCKREGATT